MFKRTLLKTKAADIPVGAHEVRLSISLNDGGSGCYGPQALLFLRGPNGSPNGTGPKTWPLFRKLTLKVRLPHVSWATGYRFRRVGGLRAYKLVYGLYDRALS
jgi:hypothetical protein